MLLSKEYLLRYKTQLVCALKKPTIFFFKRVFAVGLTEAAFDWLNEWIAGNLTRNNIFVFYFPLSDV